MPRSPWSRGPDEWWEEVYPPDEHIDLIADIDDDVPEPIVDDVEGTTLDEQTRQFQNWYQNVTANRPTRVEAAPGADSLFANGPHFAVPSRPRTGDPELDHDEEMYDEAAEEHADVNPPNEEIPADGGVIDWSSVLDASRTITDEVLDVEGTPGPGDIRVGDASRVRHDSMMGDWIAQMVQGGMLSSQQAVNFSRRLDEMPSLRDDLMRDLRENTPAPGPASARPPCLMHENCQPKEKLP